MFNRTTNISEALKIGDYRKGYYTHYNFVINYNDKEIIIKSDADVIDLKKIWNAWCEASMDYYKWHNGFVLYDDVYKMEQIPWIGHDLYGLIYNSFKDRHLVIGEKWSIYANEQKKIINGILQTYKNQVIKFNRVKIRKED